MKKDNLIYWRSCFRMILIFLSEYLYIIQADETDRVVERKEVPLFDNKAFREAIINAVLHNKWTEGNEPMISVFSDRIESYQEALYHPHRQWKAFIWGSLCL